MEYTINPLPVFTSDSRDIQMSLHYKYHPIKSHFILGTGIDFIKNHDNWGHLEMNKLIFPLILNFARGDDYKLYIGLGIYGSTNFNKKKTNKWEPTLFQFGRSVNLGFQFKIKGQFFLNVELKFLKDLTETYKDISSDPRENQFMNHKSINFGITYELGKEN